MGDILILKRVLVLCVLASIVCAAATAQAAVIFSVSINTSNFSGISGDIDFQLGSDGNNVPITASFGDFNTDAVLNGATADSSTLGYLVPLDPPNTTFTGDLASNTLSLFNNGASQSIANVGQLVSSFGNYMNFTVTFEGMGIGASSASSPSLAISFFDGSGDPLFTGPDSENYAAVFFQVDGADGSVSPTAYPTVSSPPSSPVVSAVPEPSSMLSMLMGVLGMGYCKLAGSPANALRRFLREGNSPAA